MAVSGGEAVARLRGGQIFARRNETALSATMIDDADISSAEISGRSDQPKRV